MGVTQPSYQPFSEDVDVEGIVHHHYSFDRKGNLQMVYVECIKPLEQYH